MKHGPNCTCVPCVSAARRHAIERDRREQELRDLRRRIEPIEIIGGDEK